MKARRVDQTTTSQSGEYLLGQGPRGRRSTDGFASFARTNDEDGPTSTPTPDSGRIFDAVDFDDGTSTPLELDYSRHTPAARKPPPLHSPLTAHHVPPTRAQRPAPRLRVIPFALIGLFLAIILTVATYRLLGE